MTHLFIQSSQFQVHAMSAVAVTQFLILPLYHFKEELGVLDSTPVCNYQTMRARSPIITQVLYYSLLSF